MPPTLLDSQFATLERPAADEQATIVTSDVAPEQLCEKIVAWLRDAQPAD